MTEEGRLQCGHSQDARPDLPPVTVMPAVLDPVGRPLATEVGSGERADDPLSRPGMERVQARRGRHGWCEVGDGPMAARDTRARLAAAGDVSLGPRPQGQLGEGEGEAALEAVWHGEQARSAVVREGPTGQPALLAEGDE